MSSNELGRAEFGAGRKRTIKRKDGGFDSNEIYISDSRTYHDLEERDKVIDHMARDTFARIKIIFEGDK